MLELILIRGLPGSGKSTKARQIAKDLGYEHVENDMFRTPDTSFLYAMSLCLAATVNHLFEGRSVVVANTFTRYQEMIPYLQRAEQLKAKVRIIEMTGDYGTIHKVPEKLLQEMKKRWENYEYESRNS